MFVATSNKGIATRSKKLLGAPGIATGSILATRVLFFKTSPRFLHQFPFGSVLI